jgi:hypothetical protein
MAKYRKTMKKTGRKSRKNLRKKTFRRKFRGGYNPVGTDGGAFGKKPDSYPATSSGALPDPMAAGGTPIGKAYF